jgi:uncharacterized protein YlzI (FlbEa/FlbD family)
MQTRQAAATIAATLFQYITLHAIDGREVHLNTVQIVGIAAPKDDKLFSDKARCIVHMTDGKFVSVKEDCVALKRRIEELKRKK